MLAELLLLKGALTVTPALTIVDPSGNPSVFVNILEQMAVNKKVASTLTLSTDSVYSVDLTEVGEPSFLLVKTDQKILMSITTADGISQLLPVDTLLIWVCSSSPLLALTLMRQAGVPTNVRIILAQKSA